MFKYDQFPILRLQVFNSQGVLVSKLFRSKSHQPYYQSQSYSLINVIDFESSQHLTLKKIYKLKNISKDSILSQLYNQSKMNGNDNFIQIKQIYQDNENIYLFMQENHQNLQQILNSRKILLQKQVQYIFCQLVTILQNLRINNIFHGNICLSNLYLSKQNKLKLSGFSSSINIGSLKQAQTQHTNIYNTSQLHSYIAPQLLDNTIQNASSYYSADIWAVGVVLYTLLVGKQPFMNYDSQNNIWTTSIIKIKNYIYQFPQPQLNLNSVTLNLNNNNICSTINNISNNNNNSLTANGSNNKNNKNKNISMKIIKNNQSVLPSPKSLYSNNTNNNIQSISNIWKQVIKQIFKAKDNRITLIQLIRHPLNNISQSKFIQLNTKYIPTISNNILDVQDIYLKSIQFDDSKINNTITNNSSKNNKSNNNSLLLCNSNIITNLSLNINNNNSINNNTNNNNSINTNTNNNSYNNNSINTNINNNTSNTNNKQLLTGGKINNQILHIIISQQKQVNKIPIICEIPKYIQRYCYMQINKSIGYIYQNCIGIIYHDGSCVIGHNIEQYKYISNQYNQTNNCDQVIKLYCDIYDEYYSKSQQKYNNKYNNNNSNKIQQSNNKDKLNKRRSRRQGKQGRQSMFRREGSKNNTYYNNNINNSNSNSNSNVSSESNKMNSNSSNNFSNLYSKNNNSNNVSINLNINNIGAIDFINQNITNHNINNNNSNENVNNNMNNININNNNNASNVSSSNLAISKRNNNNQSKHNLNTSTINNNNNINNNMNNNNNGITYKNQNKSKIYNSPPINITLNSNNPSLLTSKQSNILLNNNYTNLQQIPYSKFGQSFMISQNNQFLYTNNNMSILPNDKYNIYQYYLQYFGDRIIKTETNIYVIAYWKLNCGFVFLYTDGTWQINLRQGTDQQTQKKYKQYKYNNNHSNSLCNNNNLYNNNNMSQIYNLKRGKQGAVIIDKYGIAWWLKPNKNTSNILSNTNTTNNKQFDAKLGFDFTQICNKNSNNIHTVNKKQLKTKNTNNNNYSYNALAIKIARRAVQIIKNRYIKQYQDIMQPYKYNKM